VVKHILKYMVEGEGDSEKVLWDEGRKEECIKKIHYVMPYHNPMEAIKYISGFSIPEKSSTGIGVPLGGYLYYNNTYWPSGTSTNKDNNFTPAWMSINGLFSYPSDSADTTFKDPYPFIFSGASPESETQNNASVETGPLNKDSPTYINKILDWQYNGIDISSGKLLRGIKGLAWSFDLKKLGRKDFKYTLDNDKEKCDYGLVDNATLLGKYALHTDMSDEDGDVVLTTFKKAEMVNTCYGEWLKRYSLQQSVSVIVRGWEERFAGRMVELQWPGFDVLESKYNKNMIGPYLIKSVTHNWGTKSGYTQRLVLLKNAYYDSDNDSLVKAKYTNIAKGGGGVLG